MDEVCGVWRSRGRVTFTTRVSIWTMRLYLLPMLVHQTALGGGTG